MVKKITNEKNKELYQCEECNLKYENKEWAQKCEAWCKEHHSCNLEIIKQAIQENNSEQRGGVSFATIIEDFGMAVLALILILHGAR